MGIQRLLTKRELEEILHTYTSDEMSSEDLAIWSTHDIPLLIQQIELLHEYMWDLKEQIDGIGKMYE